MTQPSFTHLVRNRSQLAYCVILWQDYLNGNLTKDELVQELEKINETDLADYFQK